MSRLRVATGYFTDHVKMDRIWRLVDCEGMRFQDASKLVARLLMGKHKPLYNGQMDCGDGVVAINVKKLKFAWRRIFDKSMKYHTGYAKGLRNVPYLEMIDKGGDTWKKPFIKAVRNSMARWPQKRHMLLTKRLYLFPDDDYQGLLRRVHVIAPVPNIDGLSEHFGMGNEPTDQEMEDLFVRTVSRLPPEMVQEAMKAAQSKDSDVKRRGLEQLKELCDREISRDIAADPEFAESAMRNKVFTPLPMAD